eukprot:CAMPEP_0119321830 /NCGR_PEP_ID=MMETSP1333-20130426/56548_1 /TAXON_ID=418940 /ORGANISM="Scyphosphaera apsteinii, Strain RCC1455" /LENGTH=70 /DNA_ID=CAMNT_0007328903 /DNA_START=421 /DNA_END=634 /DNA_ORIENTATION=-
MTQRHLPEARPVNGDRTRAQALAPLTAQASAQLSVETRKEKAAHFTMLRDAIMQQVLAEVPTSVELAAVA